MYLKQFIKNTNLILISHGFGMQTQFVESLLVRLPLKLTLYTIIYPIIFFYKVYKIEEINKKYKNKKTQFQVFL